MVITLGVISTALLFWIIGFGCGVSRKNDPFPCEHWDYDLKAAQLSSLKTQLYLLEQNHQQRWLTLYPTYSTCRSCWEHRTHKCETKVYAETPDKQEIIDIAKKLVLSTDELAKMLGVK